MAVMAMAWQKMASIAKCGNKINESEKRENENQ
jgi:hypothetical protein